MCSGALFLLESHAFFHHQFQSADGSFCRVCVFGGNDMQYVVVFKPSAELCFILQPSFVICVDNPGLTTNFFESFFNGWFQ